MLRMLRPSACAWFLVTMCAAACDDASSSAGNPATGGAAGRMGMISAGSAGTAGASGSANAAGTSGRATGGSGPSAAGASSVELNVLLFSKTQAYRHESIPDGIAALQQLAVVSSWTLTATEDAAEFTAKLPAADVAVFLSTTGDILDDTEQAAFESFVARGGGFVGIHSATDTEYDWAFYGGLVGAYFREHPAIQEATVRVEDPADPLLAGIPLAWTRTDEWYAFKNNPRPNVKVLLTLDESTYAPGTATMGDHPITWSHEYEGGRAFYTALGHTKESYADPLFVQLLGRAIVWAGGR